MHLLRRIETYLKRSGITPSRFGRDAIGDRSLVFDLRRGRQLRPRTAGRIAAWIDRREGPEE